MNLTFLVVELLGDAATESSYWQQLLNGAQQAWQWIRDVLSTGGYGLLAMLLVLMCLASWLLNLITLPGNWLAVLLMALYAWLGPDAGRTRLEMTALVIGFVLALVGEILEFAAGALGASRAGASRRSTLLAILGSIIGAIVGGILGLPIPVLGSVLAALLFGGLGATAGAMLGEWTDGRNWHDSWRIGRAAFWGKTTGTIGKMLAGLLIVIVCLIAVVV